ncbi:MAG: CBS domain-containing protein [Terriglobales bacterium]
MLIQQLMIAKPFYCLPKDTVKTAAKLMLKNDVGFLPIVESKAEPRLLGALTDRDLCLRVLAKGLDPNRATIENFMTRRLIHCFPEDTVEKALELMAQGRVRRIPVVDKNERLVGVVSMDDVVCHAAFPDQRTRQTLARIYGVKLRAPKPAKVLKRAA